MSEEKLNRQQRRANERKNFKLLCKMGVPGKQLKQATKGMSLSSKIRAMKGK